MRRLTLVGTAGFDAIVWTDWDVELLLRIPVEVADERVGVAVLPVVPALVGTGDARPSFADALRQRIHSVSGRRLLGSPAQLPRWGPHLSCANERSARGGHRQDRHRHQPSSAHSHTPRPSRETKATAELAEFAEGRFLSVLSALCGCLEKKSAARNRTALFAC